MNTLKKYKFSILIFIIFLLIAIIFYFSLNNSFFLFNFIYIGGAISLGLVFFINKYKYARNCVQFAVGLYILVFLGIISKENMQIEGFFTYLFLGIFQGAVIHYFVAKIFGPFIFGRGWCGYACWTAMILDLLPYKIPRKDRIAKLSIVKYIFFILSLLFVIFILTFCKANLESILFYSFIIGNILYYIIGISLAMYLKDNRAFCKYICPISVFFKLTSYFSLLRIKVDKNKCISCNKCKKVCPMNVDITDNRRSRKNGTDCILCMECIKSCPKKAIKL